MTAECGLLPLVGCGKFDHSAFEGAELVSGATDLSPGDGNIWAFCDPEDPDFEKSMDLRGQSYSLGNFWLADRAKGSFVAVKRRPLTTVPSLLCDSINRLQRLKGSDDVSGREARTGALLKGLRERLAEDTQRW